MSGNAIPEGGCEEDWREGSGRGALDIHGLLDLFHGKVAVDLLHGVTSVFHGK